MKTLRYLMLFVALSIYGSSFAQQLIPTLKPSVAVSEFLSTLTVEQKDKMAKPWEDKERVNWDFVPKTYRAGVVIGALNAEQKEKFFQLVMSTAGATTLEKIKAIALLEAILRGVEGRKEDDTYRDPKNYYIQLFGAQELDKPWGWKIEGHHLCLNYVIDQNQVKSATPSVLCSNPAIVLEGVNKGHQLLKTEIQLALDLLQSLNARQQTKAIISDQAPKEILTYQQRKVELEAAGGISFKELNPGQQKQLKDLVVLYVTRASKFFVADMLKRIEKAGWDQTSFIWSGSTDVTPGHPHYYRIQGPEFVIEYDNYQNNGNHVHSIFRDRLNDFGDALADHYDKTHKK
ncbi:MAG: DUF3500 domain-containing protein [Saprospiraceae bacterium]|nr:DUF3500 domain-containing protein [Saprospiraceae bacterium]